MDARQIFKTVDKRGFSKPEVLHAGCDRGMCWEALVGRFNGELIYALNVADTAVGGEWEIVASRNYLSYELLQADLHKFMGGGSI